MTVESLRDRLAACDQPGLYAPESFRSRAAALDLIAAEIIDGVDGLLSEPQPPPGLRALRRSAERLQRRLLAADEALFQRLRADIRGGCRGAALRDTIAQYAGVAAGAHGQAVVGYDSLDRLINGILGGDTLPEAQLAPEPEMVLYQQTPARIIVELVDRARLGPHDQLYDLGSGMGHVATLAHLLSGAPARGVEVEPAFCAYARARAADLGLTQVEFIAADARRADYAAGTVFFMYTPFEGAMLGEVLGRLRERAQRGPIRLATYGPCTAAVAQQGWLSAPDPAEPGNYRLALFASLAR